MLFFFASCYSSHDVWYHPLPKRNLRYYAMHMRFSDELLRYFLKRGCELNSAESWTLYFSRDPDSYTPYGTAYIPNYWDLRRSSDLKLLLPTVSSPHNALKIEAQSDFYSAYPVITAIPKRSYSLKEEDAIAIKALQGKVKLRFFSQDLDLSEPPELPKLYELPQVLDKNGLIGAKNPEKNLYKDLRKGGNVEPSSRLPFQVIEKKNTLLQRAQDGTYFLNYVLMIGVNKDDEYLRIELWDLPIIFSDSEEQFQYLGELEIGQHWDKTSIENKKWEIRYDYWGRANLNFRITNYFFYWQAYLDNQLSGPQRDQFHLLRRDLQQQQAQRQQAELQQAGQQQAEPQQAELQQTGQQQAGQQAKIPRPRFVPNLAQNIAEQGHSERNFPYLRMDVSGSRNCRF